MDVLTSYLPVTSDVSVSTLNGHSSKGSTNADSPSRSSKDVFCSGNVWLFQLRCGPKFSNSFTKDIWGSNEWSHSRTNTRTGQAWTTTLKKWFVYAGLAQHQSSLSRQHCTRSLQQQKLGSHSHRLCWSAFGKARSLRRGHLLKVPQRYFSVQHDVPTDRQWQ